MKRLIVFSVVLLLLFGGLTATSWAAVQTGKFRINFNPTLPDPSGDPSVDDGWEDPASGQQWFYYGEGQPVPFWNQWWYDDPPTDKRWKEIFYDLTIESWPLYPNDPPPDTYTDRVIVAINWSNMEFPETGPGGPPPMPNEEWAIEREIIFNGALAAGDTIRVENILNGPFIVPGDPLYNPEWVSIDVWVEYTDIQLANVIEVNGMIQHECVPEPSTLVLLCMSGLGLLMYIRRR